LKENSKEAVLKLKNEGVDVIMRTGGSALLKRLRLEG